MCEREPRLSGLICVISSQSHRPLLRLRLQARGKAKGKPPPKEKRAHTHTHAETEVTGNAITSTNCVPEGSGGIGWWDVPFSPPPSFCQKAEKQRDCNKTKILSQSVLSHLPSDISGLGWALHHPGQAGGKDCNWVV